MKSLVLLMAVVSAPMFGHAEACSPNYNVSHVACQVPSGQTSSFTEKVVVRPRERNVSSNPADITRDYCQAVTDVKQAWAEKYKVDINSIELADGADNKDTGIPFADDHGTVHTLRQVSCTWRAQIPILVTKQADSCPVDHVEDTNGCFAADPVNVASGTVDGCLKMRPTSEAEFFIKSACLVDALNAAGAGGMPARFGMSDEQTASVERAIHFLAKGSKLLKPEENDHLTSFINAEMGAPK